MTTVRVQTIRDFFEGAFNAYLSIQPESIAYMSARDLTSEYYMKQPIFRTSCEFVIKELRDIFEDSNVKYPIEIANDILTTPTNDEWKNLDIFEDKIEESV